MPAVTIREKKMTQERMLFLCLVGLGFFLLALMLTTEVGGRSEHTAAATVTGTGPLCTVTCPGASAPRGPLPPHLKLVFAVGFVKLTTCLCRRTTWASWDRPPLRAVPRLV